MGGYFSDINQTAPDFGIRPKRSRDPVAMAPNIDPVAAQQIQSQDAGIDSPVGVAQAAIAAQQPLIDASLANTQAATDLTRAKTAQLTQRRFQHPLRRGISGSTPAPGQSPAMGAPITAGDPATTPGRRDLAAETAGSPAFAARVAQDWQARTAARDSRLAAVRGVIQQRNAATAAAAPVVTDIPNAVRRGVEGSARTVTGPYGGGFSFTPRRPAAIAPRAVVQQAAPSRPNPLFSGSK